MEKILAPRSLCVEAGISYFVRLVLGVSIVLRYVSVYCYISEAFLEGGGMLVLRLDDL